MGGGFVGFLFSVVAFVGGRLRATLMQGTAPGRTLRGLITFSKHNRHAASDPKRTI